MIKNMGMESTHIQMAGAIKDNGLMANNTGKAFSLLHKVLRKKVSGRMGKECNGLMMMNDISESNKNIYFFIIQTTLRNV